MDKNVIFLATIVTFVTIIVYYKYYSQNEVTRFAITCYRYYLDTIYPAELELSWARWTAHTGGSQWTSTLTPWAVQDIPSSGGTTSRRPSTRRSGDTPSRRSIQFVFADSGDRGAEEEVL